MKANETVSNSTTSDITAKRHTRLEYRKVLDGRKQPIRGLWQRGERFYARLKVEDASGKAVVRRIPLVDESGNPWRTVPQAVAALRKLEVQREDNKLPTFGQTPKFSDYVESYFDYYKQVKDAKRASTLLRERGPLKEWKKHLDGIRLHRIKKAHVNSFIAKRQAIGMSARTVNLDVIALRNVLKKAIDDGYLTTLPTQNLRPLKTTTKKRDLVTMSQINLLCEKAVGVSQNGQQFSDYVRLMAYCGSRRDETLRLKWSDVDWQNKQLVIGSDGLAKNHKPRRVDFNPTLEIHLREMASRRAPDSEWMFPSPQRGDKDIHAKTFRESLTLARNAADLPRLGFHDCRHHFISLCVMSGIDYMTIAEWVGHQDGGILIGKVYGHLAGSHKKQQAQKVNFQPVLLDQAAE
ncbi:MAG: site-specific integrase [Verrucomicrobia subdivision 3 bacterium]|nr:site-specific integrase [Limisphaerales bacterium]